MKSFTIPADYAAFRRKAIERWNELCIEQRAMALRNMYFSEKIKIHMRSRHSGLPVSCSIDFTIGKNSSVSKAQFTTDTVWHKAIESLTVPYGIPQSFGFRLALREER